MDRNSNNRSHRDTADNDTTAANNTSHTIDNNSLQNQAVNNTTIPTLKPFYKRILIVDDDIDITLTFKSALEEYYDDKIRFEVYAYNNPLAALSEFRPHYYDLLLTDINMPNMNGFQ